MMLIVAKGYNVLYWPTITIL